MPPENRPEPNVTLPYFSVDRAYHPSGNSTTGLNGAFLRLPVLPSKITTGYVREVGFNTSPYVGTRYSNNKAH